MWFWIDIPQVTSSTRRENQAEASAEANEGESSFAQPLRLVHPGSACSILVESSAIASLEMTRKGSTLWRAQRPGIYFMDYALRKAGCPELSKVLSSGRGWALGTCVG